MGPEPTGPAYPVQAAHASIPIVSAPQPSVMAQRPSVVAPGAANSML
jgi:hypothetical protein